MRALLIVLVAAVILVIAAFAFNLIDVSQTRKGELPTVSVQGGQTPAYDVNTAKVNVGSKSETVEVPRIDTTTKTIEVPTVNVTQAR